MTLVKAALQCLLTPEGAERLIDKPVKGSDGVVWGIIKSVELSARGSVLNVDVSPEYIEKIYGTSWHLGEAPVEFGGGDHEA